MGKPRAPKTRFKQVPLAIVKKIAAIVPPDEEANEAGVKVPAKKQAAVASLSNPL